MAEPLTDDARRWLAEHRNAVLITLRSDGSPQSSNVTARFDGSAFQVSVTADRAKTRNLARDARAVLHVLGSDFWSYASVSCTAELGPVSTEPGDAAGRDLLALHDAVDTRPHPDPEEFFAAMVADRRLVLTLHPLSVTGSGWTTQR
ncbi:TIGR03618 family F420-dependent PPOX class oxidoreductase [Nakamurella endophytica]|uniref:PPOX class F420-dependent enzyme n=1 Tax=Nakamurella endophytica TaxID=1748367 RepID=A0A917SW81_9ACTN|nr:TIGR03618 family F420-dependent PPOX class oxidoreductase [Nakamurella endophytica]GGM00908.1 PPOX class F420-dependent enzyme [Nakamurella endophytica]